MKPAKEAVWIVDPELHDCLKSPAHGRYWEKRRHSQVNEISRWKNRAIIQSEKESKWSLLGGSLSCSGCRKRRASGAMSCLFGHEHGWVAEHLGDGTKGRQDVRADSVAVGSKSFIESVKASLGFRVRGRDVIESGEGYQLRENPARYKAFFEAENEDIGLENTRFWDVTVE